MTIKTAIIALLITCGFTSKPTSGFTVPNGAFQDSIPPLHTIKSRDISWVKASDSDQTLTVVLKNKTVYVYMLEDWDLEDLNPSTDARIVASIKSMERVFTKAEQPPAFPGGEEAWNKYMQAFCVQHAKEIKRKGPADITLRFIVHVKGQIVDLQVLSNSADESALSALAMEAIRKGPAWVPAVQNGRAVVCFATQVVKLDPQ